ncbi:gamma-glutamyl-gamma-aminobutyrate hydrolase family protein [Microbacterium sp. VKM Ac-2923]|uniref:gamma-glutamyl-gamma-aminobutyrate hydrolase family protein n=1 Tax=Microbacterium sp. VKM Ac-2923 TaxID=2929476 RepID=UPI001FB41E56|nr:gamma-glutamyl-gamma-aminobutyrate hydrolase family protein [Microbacterium sp. VKM Ac-2923]MCJ1709447.1 gamma-glutamyl-gamma-aminobutyrate hydrolase family protein [Microbacterium sp. VKM Ac-2923]
MPSAALVHIRDTRPDAPHYQALLDDLNGGAVTALRAAGWDVDLRPAADESLDTLLDAARRADVVVILGGEDVDPQAYGSPDLRPRWTPYDTAADEAQLAVIRDTVAAGRPLLGICRGMQLVNVALGGTLHQDIAGHRGSVGDPFVATAVRFDRPDPISAAGDLLCSHHQSVDRLGEGLDATARAADGTIEAVRHRELPVWAYQWHLEHPLSADRQLVPAMAALLTASTA